MEIAYQKRFIYHLLTFMTFNERQQHIAFNETNTCYVHHKLSMVLMFLVFYFIEIIIITLPFPEEIGFVSE